MIDAITLMNGTTIERMEGQFFQLSQSEKSYELWDGGNLPRFIQRFRRSSVVWISEDVGDLITRG